MVIAVAGHKVPLLPKVMVDAHDAKVVVLRYAHISPEIGSVDAVAFTITTASLPNAFTNNGVQSGKPYSAQIAATGGAGGATTFSLISGALPSSIQLNTSTGALTSPSVSDPGALYSFTIQAVSAGPPSSIATQPLTITVVPTLIGSTSNPLPGGTVGVAYTTNLISSGGAAPLTYELAPGIAGNAFPPGLSISALNATTGQLTGTPTQAGTFNFTIEALDSSSPQQTYLENLGVTIAAPAIPPASVIFTTAPANSIGGQLLSPGPISVSSAGRIR